MNRPPRPRPRKSLGQHFLRSPSVIAKITEDCPEDSQGIVEIGPGAGALTRALAALKKPFVLIEKDARFQEVLCPLLKPSQTLLIKDALTIDYTDLSHTYFKGCPFWLVSNLPYSIAAPLMVILFSQSLLKGMTLMMQKEVALKILPEPKTPNQASSLWSLAQTYFHVKKLLSLSPQAFYPPPKVHSTVLSFTRRQNPAIALKEFSRFEIFVRLLFAHKRKQLQNVLSSHYPKETLKGLNLSLMLRAECLDLQQVQSLFKHLGCPPPDLP